MDLATFIDWVFAIVNVAAVRCAASAAITNLAESTVVLRICVVGDRYAKSLTTGTSTRLTGAVTMGVTTESVDTISTCTTFVECTGVAIGHLWHARVA